MESNASGIPIDRKELEQFSERASRLLTSAKWAPPADIFVAAKPKASSVAWRESSEATASLEETSLFKIAREISRDPILLTQDVNYTLTTVRDGLRIGMHLSKLYTKHSGLDQLIVLNQKGALTEQQKTEFRGKYASASAIALFVTASYVVWELSGYKSEEVSGITLESRGVPEMTLQDPVRGLECLVFYYGALIEREGTVRTDLEFVRFTLNYFRATIDELRLRQESLSFTEAFASQTYRLENSEFSVHGFKPVHRGVEVSMEFNKVRLDQIVGNKEAKHHIHRLAMRLLCYDKQSKRNPMYDLGGLSSVTMGYGEPGTGKSMLISALATLLDEHCRELGIPFLFWPMPDTVVSTFQGGSAERMMGWMKALKDPTKIIYAPIDDAENNLEERSRQGVSAGVREVIAVFLRNTEGAYAVHQGNMVIHLFTNLPEQIDKAVLSRIGSRFYIGGARTKEDFIDQDYLWHRKYDALDPGFLKMKPPKKYEYLAAQGRWTPEGTKRAGTLELDDRLGPIVEHAQRAHERGEHEFFGELFVKMQQTYPFFTSRDIRNIQRSIDGRIMDFDFPQEWFSNHELFFRKSYDEKRAMLVELMKSNLRGLSFADVRFEETTKYLTNVFKISENDRERRLTELTDELRLRRDAESRLTRRE